MKRTPRLALILLLALSSLSCQLVTSALQPTPKIQPIVFAEDVIDGQPYQPGSEFPAGTITVWAYIPFEGMRDGARWSRVWEKDGELFYASGDEAWEDGESGYVAYSISEDDTAPLRGHYTLKVYLGDELAQQASFTIAAAAPVQSASFPAFGPVQFAHGVTEARLPVQPAAEFEQGVPEVFAIFPYTALAAEQSWHFTWTQNGQVVASQEAEAWNGKPSGLTYLSLTFADGFPPGEYALNLYLDDQIARSATFTVVGSVAAPEAPGTPAELIDADLLPAWQILYDASDTYNFLHDLAQFALDHHVAIRMDDDYDGAAMAYYTKDENSCQPNYTPGYVAVTRQTWNTSSWQELAGILAHELEHAQQHYQGGDYRCPGCSIYKEYHSHIVQYYTWLMIGRQDLIPDRMYDSSGTFNPDYLWDYIKEVYGDSCPDY